MNKIYKTLATLFAALLLIPTSLWAKICGNVEVAAAIIDIDILESGKTVDTLHMKAAKFDARIAFYRGWFLKPSFMYAGSDGKLVTGGIGIGHCYPLKDVCMPDYLTFLNNLTLLPSVGIGWSYLRTTVDIDFLQQYDLTEKFHSTSPYVCLEFYYKITPKWYLMGFYQYAWSRTTTTIKPFVKDKSHSDGPNYGLGIEYCFDKHWSLTFGLGYNITLTHEKHGLRGKGGKLGISYYY